MIGNLLCWAEHSKRQAKCSRSLWSPSYLWSPHHPSATGMAEDLPLGLYAKGMCATDKEGGCLFQGQKQPWLQGIAARALPAWETCFMLLNFSVLWEELAENRQIPQVRLDTLALCSRRVSCLGLRWVGLVLWQVPPLCCCRQMWHSLVLISGNTSEATGSNHC